jgi:RNA-directed DNA polymerase
MPIKAHSLIGRIDLRLITESFKAVKRNRGAAGVDKVSVDMFAANLEQNLSALMRDLKAGTFQPQVLRRVFIPKDLEGTEFRPIGIPVVRDRVAQEVLRRLLSPIFEPHFHPASYGFRPHRNAHQAVEAALALHGQGKRHVLDADIKGFFDNLPHEAIMEAVAEKVADGKVLALLERFLHCGVLENGRLLATTRGTPQGGVISPLLANIVLNKLDWQMQAAGHSVVRYADDFVVISQTRQQAEEALILAADILQGLGLELSPEKTKILTYGKGYSFLGFILSSQSRRIRPKSLGKFKETVRRLSRRSWNLDVDRVEHLNRVLRGIGRYFGAAFVTNREQFHKLDSWIRSDAIQTQDHQG